MKNHIKILATAAYQPKRCIPNEYLEKKMSLTPGWINEKTGIQKRYYTDIETETISFMGARAAERALEIAGVEFTDLDFMISAGGSPQQLIPCNAALIQKEMGQGGSGVPCFDINSTCLSFVYALDLAQNYFQNDSCNKILIVSSEISSVGINYEDPDSAGLFGDGAVAVLLTKKLTTDIDTYYSSFETYGAGAELAEIKGGGTALYSTQFNEKNKKDYFFSMNGKGIYKMTSQYLPALFNKCLQGSGIKVDERLKVIPHQAGLMPLKLVQKKLGLTDEQYIITVQDHGNLIAASIPMALHLSLTKGSLSSGDNVLLLGTSAGFSIGIVILSI